MIEPLTLAIYSQLAYEPLVAVQVALPEAKVTLLDRDDSQAYVIETDVETVVAFRGTQVTSDFSMTDVLRNARIALVPLGLSQGKVHAGYKEAVDVIADDLVEALVHAVRPFKYTGHSLGGSVATHARTRVPHPDMTVTFGAPKVGDRQFIKAHANIPLIRYSHARDIAPKHPRPWLGYQHGGEFRKIMRDGKIIKRPWRWYDELILPGDLTRGTFDHRVGEYVEKLRGVEI